MILQPVQERSVVVTGLVESSNNGMHPSQVIASPSSSGGWETALNWTQGTLDVFGLVPGLGEIADGVNGLISLGRGNTLEAGLSFAAMIPFVGWGATGTKFAARYGDEVLGFADEVGDFAAKAGGLSSVRT